MSQGCKLKNKCRISHNNIMLEKSKIKIKKL